MGGFACSTACSDTGRRGHNTRFAIHAAAHAKVEQAPSWQVFSLLPTKLIKKQWEG
jgi:hypothetical protein